MADVTIDKQKVISIPASTETTLVFPERIQAVVIVNMIASGETQPSTVYFRTDGIAAVVADDECQELNADLTAIELFEDKWINKISFISTAASKIQLFNIR